MPKYTMRRLRTYPDVRGAAKEAAASAVQTNKDRRAECMIESGGIEMCGGADSMWWGWPAAGGGEEKEPRLKRHRRQMAGFICARRRNGLKFVCLGWM